MNYSLREISETSLDMILIVSGQKNRNKVYEKIGNKYTALKNSILFLIPLVILFPLILQMFFAEKGKISMYLYIFLLCSAYLFLYIFLNLILGIHSLVSYFILKIAKIKIEYLHIFNLNIILSPYITFILLVIKLNFINYFSLFLILILIVFIIYIYLKGIEYLSGSKIYNIFLILLSGYIFLGISIKIIDIIIENFFN